MVRRRSSSLGKNASLGTTFITPEPEGELPATHVCFWYEASTCSTRNGSCVNIDSPHIVCPIKPSG